jgi:hypothetical protein
MVVVILQEQLNSMGRWIQHSNTEVRIEEYFLVLPLKILSQLANHFEWLYYYELLKESAKK